MGQGAGQKNATLSKHLSCLARDLAVIWNLALNLKKYMYNLYRLGPWVTRLIPTKESFDCSNFDYNGDPGLILI
jgi:hypothetical protein